MIIINEYENWLIHLILQVRGERIMDSIPFDALYKAYESQFSNLEEWEKREADMYREKYIYSFERFCDAVRDVMAGKRYQLIDFYVDGDALKPMKYDSLFTFKTDGLIAFNDWMPLMDTLPQPKGTINSRYSNHRTTEHYIKRNVLHGFVGNSCPLLVYSEHHGELIVGVERDADGKPILPDDTYSVLGNITTNYFWYTIVDASQWPEDSIEGITASITPGTWVMEHYYGIAERGYHEKPYAKMKLQKP